MARQAGANGRRRRAREREEHPAGLEALRRAGRPVLLALDEAHAVAPDPEAPGRRDVAHAVELALDGRDDGPEPPAWNHRDAGAVAHALRASDSGADAPGTAEPEHQTSTSSPDATTPVRPSGTGHRSWSRATHSSQRASQWT